MREIAVLRFLCKGCCKRSEPQGVFLVGDCIAYCGKEVKPFHIVTLNRESSLQDQTIVSLILIVRLLWSIKENRCKFLNILSLHLPECAGHSPHKAPLTLHIRFQFFRALPVSLSDCFRIIGMCCYCTGGTISALHSGRYPFAHRV